MPQTHPTNHQISAKRMKVWVLAPYLQNSDENIDYYYDFSQSIAEYTKAFEELAVDWIWQPVTTANFTTIIDSIIIEKEMGEVFPVVFNICDGDEINGTPGISVVKLLEEKGLVYTGADEYFYDITTSKIPMKIAFDLANIPTAKWEAVHTQSHNLNNIFEKLGTPLIVKPAVSGGSMGLGIKNVVSNGVDLKAQIDLMFAGYRGWDLTTDGIVVESFINGNEYTTLIVGSHDQPANATIYNPVQRVFHPSLPEKERILSFDRLWEVYEEESPMPNDGNFYEYQAPDPDLIEELKKISWDAYVATKGKGYTRVDIRQDSETGKFYVLEVNAQCGLSEDEDYTSIGAILRLSNQTFTGLVKKIIDAALLSSSSLRKKIPYH